MTARIDDMYPPDLPPGCSIGMVDRSAHRGDAEQSAAEQCSRCGGTETPTCCADLLAASSVGAGLADIEERGIDAYVVDLEQEMEPKKKRKASTSPTARTLAECRRRGWIAGVVERRIPFPKPQGTTIDLFGVIDLIAIAPADDPILGRPQIVGIQATGGTANHAHRRTKILAEPRMRAWLETGARLELWSWNQQGARGKRKLWTLRVEAFTLADWPAT